MTARECAQQLGVVDTTFDAWVRNGRITRQSVGQYDISSVRREIVENSVEWQVEIARPGLYRAWRQAIAVEDGLDPEAVPVYKPRTESKYKAQKNLLNNPFKGKSKAQPPLPKVPSPGSSTEASSDAPPTTQGIYARKEFAAARLKEIQLAEKEGSLVNFDETKAAWQQLGIQLRDNILSLPDRLALRLEHKPARVCRELLMRELTAALRDITDGVTN